MKKVLTILSAFAVIIMITVIACNSNGAKQRNEGMSSSAISHDSAVKRGAYLVNIMGCDDCHSPKVFGPNGPEVDMERRLSGHPRSFTNPKPDTAALRSWVLFNHMTTSMVGPWGVSFAANLTSDDTGIGTWSEEQFLTAIRKGKFKGLENSRGLLPPMPWQQYAKASDEDLKAIFAFLKSTKPVENIVPPAISPDRLLANN